MYLLSVVRLELFFFKLLLPLLLSCNNNIFLDRNIIRYLEFSLVRRLGKTFS